MCQSDLPQCAYVVLDVLFFTVLCFRHGFHKAVILFLKQLPHPWETLPGGGRESPLIKLYSDVHSERRCLCTHGVTIGFVSLRTVVLAVSFERSNACAYASSCLGVLQKISPRTPSAHLLRFVGFSCQGQLAMDFRQPTLVWDQIWEVGLARASIQRMGTGHEG